MAIKSATTYDPLIQSMCYNLELERMLDTIHDMHKQSIIPTRSSYVAILTLALKFEDAPSAMFILDEMERYNMINDASKNLYLQVLSCAALSEEVSTKATDKLLHVPSS
jgi:pentatricopeptide repeat protein